MPKSRSEQLRDLAIHGRNLGQEVRAMLFAVADELEGHEPIPYRLTVKESGIS